MTIAKTWEVSQTSIVRQEIYGRTASLISPLRDFMRSNACGRSASRISSVTKSCAEMSPRRMASSASRINRGVWWNGEINLISE